MDVEEYLILKPDATFYKTQTTLLKQNKQVDDQVLIHLVDSFRKLIFCRPQKWKMMSFFFAPCFAFGSFFSATERRTR